jgi:7-cyano-7-deazaguanine synthase
MAPARDKKKGIVLLSGGMDSATVLFLAKNRGYDLTALIFDYHQSHHKEVECAKKLCRKAGTPYYLIKTGLPWTRSSLTRKNIPVELNRKLLNKKIPLTYVSGRNIIFLSYAVSCAESLNAANVFIGAHIHDYSGYPDCRPAFLRAFQKAAGLGTKRGMIRILAPLLNKSKKDIIATGISLGVPYAMTWSCYKGGKRPCGLCDSCRYRSQGFAALGVKDPLEKK